MEIIKKLDHIVNWIQKEVLKAKAKGVIVGISGGIDSALVAYLAKEAFPYNSLGVLIPINSERWFDLEDGLELAYQLGLRYRIVNLEEQYKAIKSQINLNNDLINGNLQARLRMMVIYALAQEHNYLVLGTDNKAEYDLGYFTKYGDGGCDLLPISHLFKSEVFEYAKAIGIPKTILKKTPSAGLWAGQSDEKELGFSYNDYELFCKNKLYDNEIRDKIIKQINKTNHKRQPIPQFKESR